MPWKSWRYRSTNWNTLPLSTNLKAGKKLFFLTLCCVYSRLHSAISQRTVTLWVYLKFTSPWNNDVAFYSHHYRLYFLLQGPIKMAKTFLNEYYATYVKIFSSTLDIFLVIISRYGLKFLYWCERVILSSNLSAFCRQDSKLVFVFERSWIWNSSRKRATQIRFSCLFFNISIHIQD